MMEVALNVYHPVSGGIAEKNRFSILETMSRLSPAHPVFTHLGAHVKTAIRVKSILSRVCCSVLGLPLEAISQVSPKIQYMSAVMPPPPAKLAADPCHDEMRLVFFQRKIRGGRKGGV